MEILILLGWFFLGLIPTIVLFFYVWELGGDITWRFYILEGVIFLSGPISFILMILFKILLKFIKVDTEGVYED
ncbi:MAG TPA: hypothetical protein P5136_00120 [Methanofastidiosum sp.]|nr:hypothetical protein [Methanofastidiosum sp.]